MGLGAVVGAVGSIIGGKAQGDAAEDAARAQSKAAGEQLALQERMYDEQTKRFKPYLGSGGNALKAYNFEMGLGERPTFGGTAPQIETFTEGQGWSSGSQGGPGNMGPGSGGAPVAGQPGGNPLGGPGGFSQILFDSMTGYKNGGAMGGSAAPAAQRFRVGGKEFATMEEAQAFARNNKTGGTEYQGYQASPGFKWQMEQGNAAIDASAAARGGLMSGRTLEALQANGQGLAQQDRETYLSRLAGMTDMGMGAAGMQATAGNNFAAGAGNALANRGNAQAAGAIGQGNALAGMFNGVGQAIGYMNKPQTTGPQFGGGR